MANCEICEKDMLKSEGCSDKDYIIDGKRFAALPYLNFYLSGGDRCHDCNCADGEFHHTGCDMEECPRCTGQFISCECEISEVMYVFKEKRVLK